MCLIVLAWRVQARYPLVLAGNRDEYYARPSEPVHWWLPEKRILAGRDLEAGGTWLGLSRDGRLATVTNYREAKQSRAAGAPSRGALVTGFLGAGTTPGPYLAASRARHPDYSGFNLLLASALGMPGAELWIDSNRDPAAGRALAPGIYGLSNGHLDDPWPKVVHAKSALGAALTKHGEGEPDALAESLFAALADARPATDQALPQTGIPLDLERALSSAFVHLPGYGTRASSVVLVDAEGHAHLIERSFDASGAGATRRHAFRLERHATEGSGAAAVGQAAP